MNRPTKKVKFFEEEPDLMENQDVVEQGGNVVVDPTEPEEPNPNDFAILPDEMLLHTLNYMSPIELYRFCGSGPVIWQRCQGIKSAMSHRHLELTFYVYTNNAQGSEDTYGTITVLITYNPLDLLQLIGVIHQIRTDVNELFHGDGAYAHLITDPHHIIELFDMDNFVGDVLSAIKENNEWPRYLFVDVDAPYDHIQMIVRYTNVNWDQKRLRTQSSPNTPISLDLATNEQWAADRLVNVQVRYANPQIPIEMERIAAQFVNQVINDERN